MKTGYSRFPQAGVPRLDFRYRSNANDGNKLPRTYPDEFPPIKKGHQGVLFLLAVAKGFEPLRLLGKRFSRPPRYDHFDKLPFI